MTSAKLRMIRSCENRGEPPRCHFCSCELTADTATVDHLRPRCRGGTNASENLVLSCQSCNCTKGNRTEAEFRAGIVIRSPGANREPRKGYGRKLRKSAGFKFWYVAKGAEMMLNDAVDWGAPI